MMELWDAYDEILNKFEGMTLVRGEEGPDGVFNLVCEIIVRHTDGTYLLMQRDPQKHLGGMWEATAGGSALQGEDPITCALRELSEETGIKADKLTEVGRVLASTLALKGDTEEAIELMERDLPISINEKQKSTMRAALCFLYLKAGREDKACKLASQLPHMRESREVVQPLIKQGLSDSQIDENIKTIILGDGEGIW